MAIFNGSAEDIQSKQNMLSNLEAEEGADKYPSVLGTKMYVADKIQVEREYNQQALDGKENISNKTNDLIANGGSEEMYPSASAVREYVDKKIGEIGGGGDSSDVDLSKCANALKSKASGKVIRIDDVSPIEHAVKAKVRSKNLLNADGMANASFVKNNDGSFTFTKTSSSRFSNLVDISIPANTNFAFSATNIEGTAANFAFQVKCKDGRYLSFGPFSPTNLSYRGAYISSEVEAVRVFFDSSVADEAYLNISGLQIELGKVTEYVPYVDVSTVSVIVSSDEAGTSAAAYTPNADGIVEGIKSLYPSMVITTDAEGAIIELEYNKDINTRSNMRLLGEVEITEAVAEVTFDGFEVDDIYVYTKGLKTDKSSTCGCFLRLNDSVKGTLAEAMYTANVFNAITTQEGFALVSEIGGGYKYKISTPKPDLEVNAKEIKTLGPMCEQVGKITKVTLVSSEASTYPFTSGLIRLFGR